VGELQVIYVSGEGVVKTDTITTAAKATQQAQFNVTHFTQIRQ